MSEFGKTEATLLAFGVAGALALTGCSSDSPSSKESSASSHSAAVSSAIESAASAPDQQVLTDHVDGGPVGAMRDEALTIATEVSDVDASTDDIDQAYRDAASIPNPTIRNKASAYISWRLAANTQYVDQHIYTYEGYDDSTTHSDSDAVTAAEGVVDKIQDPTVRAAADKNLDYVEAHSAVEAAVGTSPNQQLASYLLSTVEDQTILAQAKAQIGANGQVDQYYLNDDARKMNDSIKASEGVAFNALYNGSNEQAKSLNDAIAAFNQARSEAGN